MVLRSWDKQPNLEQLACHGHISSQMATIGLPRVCASYFAIANERTSVLDAWPGMEFWDLVVKSVHQRWPIHLLSTIAALPPNLVCVWGGGGFCAESAQALRCALWSAQGTLILWVLALLSSLIALLCSSPGR